MKTDKTNDKKVKKKNDNSVSTFEKKWLKAAIEMGGLDSKIVVSKSKAKAMIFNMMMNVCKPMTITDIYKVSMNLALLSFIRYFYFQRICLSSIAAQGRSSLSCPQSLSRKYGLIA